MPSFHYFSKLSLEIRWMIWHDALEQAYHDRRVSISFYRTSWDDDVKDGKNWLFNWIAHDKRWKQDYWPEEGDSVGVKAASKTTRHILLSCREANSYAEFLRQKQLRQFPDARPDGTPEQVDFYNFVKSVSFEFDTFCVQAPHLLSNCVNLPPFMYHIRHLILDLSDGRAAELITAAILSFRADATRGGTADYRLPLGPPDQPLSQLRTGVVRVHAGHLIDDWDVLQPELDTTTVRRLALGEFLPDLSRIPVLLIDLATILLSSPTDALLAPWPGHGHFEHDLEYWEPRVQLCYCFHGDMKSRLEQLAAETQGPLSTEEQKEWLDMLRAYLSSGLFRICHRQRDLATVELGSWSWDRSGWDLDSRLELIDGVHLQGSILAA